MTTHHSQLPIGVRIGFLIVVLVFLRAGSCLRIERPYPPPSSEALLAAIQHHGRAVRTLRAEARMTRITPRERIEARVRLMGKKPGELRFDVVSPFDTPIATLVSHGERFALLDAQNSRHYFGPASPCNLSRLLHVQLPPEEVLTILAGGAPLIAHATRTVAWDERDGVEVLRLESATLEQVIRLDPTKKRWSVLSFEIRTTAGQVVLRSRASAHRRIGRLWVPQRIDLQQPQQDSAIELRFEHQELNISLPAAAFELPESGGFPSEEVTCG
jgi:outer membrane lipoprotein-sorting protein